MTSAVRRAVRRDVLIALAAAVLYAALGAAVSHAPQSAIDRAARPLAGHEIHVAWIFTASCLWPVLVSFGLIGVVVAFFVHGRWRERIITAVLTTLIFQAVAKGSSTVTVPNLTVRNSQGQVVYSGSPQMTITVK